METGRPRSFGANTCPESVQFLAVRKLTSAQVATPRAGPTDANTPQKNRRMMRPVILCGAVSRGSQIVITHVSATAVPMQKMTKQIWEVW